MAYPDFRFLNKSIETLPRAELRRLQEQKLGAVLDDAYRNAPLITALWQKAGVRPADIRSLDDFFEKVPCFDKDDIRRFRDAHGDPCGGLARLSDIALNKIATTSGTTGDPTPFPIRLRASSDEGYARDMWGMGTRPGDYVLFAGFSFRIGIGNPALLNDAGLIPIVFRHDPHQIPRMADAIRKFRPTLFTLMSTPMMMGFEQWFKDSGVDPRELFAPLKAVIYGGEALSPRLRALTQSWGLNVYETTSFGDVMSATTCQADAGFHAYEDMAIAECLDPHGTEPVAEGEVGELVVTTLANPEVPFVRFRTDDLVVMNYDPCSCGRTHARFTVRGRKGDQITVQGKMILPLDLRFAIEAEPETQSGLFQIIKTAAAMDVLHLRVGHDPARITTSASELEGRLADLVRGLVDVPVRIELTPNAELLKLGPPHKIPRVAKA